MAVMFGLIKKRKGKIVEKISIDLGNDGITE
jgi:hypothetical protein